MGLTRPWSLAAATWASNQANSSNYRIRIQDGKDSRQFDRQSDEGLQHLAGA